MISNKDNFTRIIAGSGRSGTTWILDVLAESNKLDTVFEPLHPKCVPGVGKFANNYIRDDDFVPELQRLIEKIFKGNMKNIWTNYRIRPDRFNPWSDNPAFQHQNDNLFNKCHILLSGFKKFFINYLKYRKKTGAIIVKFIRANLMLGWISKNFDVKIVFVVRHPASVIASMLRKLEKDGVNDWGVKSALHKYWSNIHLREDYLKSYEDVFNEKLSLTSELAVIWCIENTIPIIKAQKNKQCVIFYEDLITEPKRNWEIIVKSLGLENIPDEKIYRKPSHEASDEIKNFVSKFDQLNKWKSHLKKDQIDDISNILKKFKINIYSVDEPLPIKRIQTDEHLFNCEIMNKE